MKTPLEGVRVLDLSRLVAGNVLTTQLADFGADVIKIERPGRGDDLRHWRERGLKPGGKYTDATSAASCLISRSQKI